MSDISRTIRAISKEDDWFRMILNIVRNDALHQGIDRGDPALKVETSGILVFHLGHPARERTGSKGPLSSCNLELNLRFFGPCRSHAGYPKWQSSPHMGLLCAIGLQEGCIRGSI